VPARVRRDANAGAVDIPIAQQTAKIHHSEEAQRSRESSNSTGQTPVKRNVEQFKRMTIEELVEMLRKVNLTFDTFEIQAKFTIDRTNGEISIEVINQRTGEVIRKIPPYDVPEMANLLLNGEALVTDIKA
jgi:uncharacterized FlaG/YvyC family protein